MMDETRIAIFKGKQIRKTIHNNEWWFSVADVVEALTDSVDPRQYIKKMRKRDNALDSYWGTICTPLEITANDGKKRMVNCANTEGVFRIVQSIPSPKAEPFKRWLARVGYERIQEIEDPELATKRTKGYNDLELIFSMLGEAATTEIARNHNSQGFHQNKTAAGKGGRIAGDAREKLEKETGKKVSTRKNYLTGRENNFLENE